MPRTQEITDDTVETRYNLSDFADFMILVCNFQCYDSLVHFCYITIVDALHLRL